MYTYVYIHISYYYSKLLDYLIADGYCRKVYFILDVK